jgi:glycosyltransferase involved in cell wall biosynthesis
LGIDHDLFRIPVDSGDDLARRLDLNGPWFCTVGTHEPRKNLATVVRAFDLLLERLGDSDLLLVLAGARGWKNDEFDALLQGCAPSTRGRIRTPGFLDDSYLPILYARSCGFLFPSLEEGFGLPPLEAMACGAPVIASSSSCMPEILGEAALLVPPCSVESWCDAMAALVTPDGPAARLREAGPRKAAGFTWRTMADRLVESLIRTPG